jgi:hypothetical protein
MFGRRTWLTNAMHIDMPNRLFSIQWPETSQATTIKEQVNNSIPWIRVKDFEQQRETKGSAKPKCDFK